MARAKDERSHGTWLAWLGKNFEGSIRTAQVYMDLASRRAGIEAANAQSSAHLSIARALQITRPTVGPVPGTEPGAELPPEIEKELEEERGFWLAWKQPQEEGLANMREAEQEERIREAGRKLVPVANGLHELAHPGSGYKPEEAGEALARMGDARTIAALRNCAAWLERVIEEAEATR